MLSRLTITNFAIISHMEIDFHPGLNILSGETGAGKSIIISAVNLILGGRASADLIRSGENEARVEAFFNLPDNPTLEKILSDMGFPYDGEILIKRTISVNGRNRITINGSSATLQMLSLVGMMMISISGQHEHQLLLRPENHLLFLDEYGGLEGLRGRLSETYHEYQSLKERRDRFEKEIKAGLEKQELNNFQMKEISDAGIREGEDISLEDERKRLKYAEQLKDVVSESYQILYEREDSLLSGISMCIKGLEKVAQIDGRLDSLGKTLTSIKAELEEAGLQLRDLQGDIVMDPNRLDEVEERLQLINRFKRKYGPSIKDILSYGKTLAGIFDDLEWKNRQLETIDRELNKLERETVSISIDLSKKRRLASERLQKSIEEELNLLDMGGTRFEVRFNQEYLTDQNDSRLLQIMTSDGFDRIEFLLSPNRGEVLRPLSKIASGGELSRIMLALKTLLAGQKSLDTVIFDEVDSGIGGAPAEVVGEKLQSLAEYHQILCITHLPQIASKGVTHFHVQKRVKDDRTQTMIYRLDPEARVREIARLLGGKVISEQALDHAREMLGEKGRAKGKKEIHVIKS